MEKSKLTFWPTQYLFKEFVLHHNLHSTVGTKEWNQHRIFKAVKMFWMIPSWWIQAFSHVSESTGPTTPRGSPSISDGLSGHNLVSTRLISVLGGTSLPFGWCHCHCLEPWVAPSQGPSAATGLPAPRALLEWGLRNCLLSKCPSLLWGNSLWAALQKGISNTETSSQICPFVFVFLLVR